jgi:succinate--hydroxymethylglutarate CoA-transferase
VTAKSPVLRTLLAAFSSRARKIVDDGAQLTVRLSILPLRTALISHTATVVPYRAYKTKDTNIAVGGCNDKLYGILCRKLGKPEWITDARFVTNALRVQHRDILDAMVEAELQLRTTQEWLEIFDGSGMPYAAVNDIHQTMNHEHVLARNMIEEIDHPACGKVKLVNHPVKYSRVEPKIRSPPPLLGEHTDEVLRELLGLDESEIGELRQGKTVA